jgi:tetratricopeptide (TPR) repeat protein
MWDEAAAMNERSIKAADDRVAAKNLDVDNRGLHALLWTMYAYVQQGRYRDARGVLDQIDAAAAKSGSVRTRSHLALARAAWLVDTRRWADAKSPVVSKGLGGEAMAADLFAVGWAALRRGDRMAANDALQQMALLAGDGDRPVPSAPTRPGVKPVAPSAPGVKPIAPQAAPPAPDPAAAHGGHQAGQGQPQTGLPAAGAGGDKRVPAVLAQLLEAGLLFLEGRRDEAVILAKQAAVVEDTLSFEFGPPVPVKPAHELAGELFLDMRRPQEAQREFEASLKRAPRRALSLLGLYRAATAAKDQATARRAADELRQIWRRADKDLPELKELGITPSSSF